MVPVEISLPDGASRQFHPLWLRDNCPCDRCRVAQSSERLAYTGDLSEELQLIAQRAGEGRVELDWSDGHRSVYSLDWLSGAGRALAPATRQLWRAEDALPRFSHDAIEADTATRLSFVDAIEAFGAAIVEGVPSQSGYALGWVDRHSDIREVPFGRLHDVRNDPAGYNVAHTAEALPLHTDLASLPYPPSLQVLHYLSNEAVGGASLLVDGWAVLADLQAEHPAHFETLCELPVSFQIFSSERDTRSHGPMVERDHTGSVCRFRFSNQTAQPLCLDLADTERFYRAYLQLSRMIADPHYQQVIDTRSGDMLVVHNHRVLHGRQAFQPASGARHLQDVYGDYDDLLAGARVIRGHTAGVHPVVASDA